MEILKNIDPKDLSSVDAWFWAYWNKIKLQSWVFSLEGHEYLIEPMQSQVRHRVMKKGAQMGFTEEEVLRTLHGMIFGSYPLGVLYLFPTADDVLDFGKTRFKPLLENNYQNIGKYVGGTEAAELKQIGKGYLYLRGARPGSKIEGIKKESHKLRTIPADKVVRDERDLMDPDMVVMSNERMSHSLVKEEVDLSTPTIPDFGIDRLYQDSDQRIWVIDCPSCHRECCLELDFPECVKFKNGKGYRACLKCGAELLPSLGRWVAQNPKNEMAGWWISQLNSVYIDPGTILNLYNNPPNGNLQEVYNSKLAMAYIATENRLSMQDIYACCGPHAISYQDKGPCGMGVDVGKNLSVIIGKRLFGGKRKIVWIGEVPEFEDLDDLIKRFNVKVVAIDYEPETRKAREFRARASGHTVYLCDERDKVKEGEKLAENAGVMTVARTELCDMTHQMIAKCQYIFPRRSPQIDEYARHLTNMAKVLEEDEKQNRKIYRYRKLGPDHFYHATNFFEVAAKFLSEATEDRFGDGIREMAFRFNQQYSPLTFGMDDRNLMS